MHGASQCEVDYLRWMQREGVKQTRISHAWHVRDAQSRVMGHVAVRYFMVVTCQSRAWPRVVACTRKSCTPKVRSAPPMVVCQEMSKGIARRGVDVARMLWMAPHVNRRSCAVLVTRTFGAGDAVSLFLLQRATSGRLTKPSSKLQPSILP